MKQKKIIFGICILIITIVVAVEKQDTFGVGDSIEIIEAVEGPTGEPCTGCDVNLTLYNEDGTEHQTCIMQELAAGVYNCSLNTNLTEGIYPMVIAGTKGNYSGISDRNQITILKDLDEGEDRMISLAFIVLYLGIAFILIWASFRIPQVYDNRFAMIAPLFFFVGLFLLIHSLGVGQNFVDESNSTLAVSTVSTLTNRFTTQSKILNQVIWFSIMFFIIVLLWNSFDYLKSLVPNRGRLRPKRIRIK